jgi:hypothetical protein
MSSEWMKVMLEEISRKKAEIEQARAEERLRGDERERPTAPKREDEQVLGDQPVAPPGPGADRARG